MIKQLAWNTFKNTGNIDTYLELIESKDYSDLTLFKLQRFFLDIVKNISNDYIKNNM